MFDILFIVHTLSFYMELKIKDKFGQNREHIAKHDKRPANGGKKHDNTKKVLFLIANY